MKTTVCTLFLLTLVACALSSPIGSVDESGVLFDQSQVISDQPEVLPEEPENHKDIESHLRFKRFTCDVLSIEAKGVKLNDAACAIHCLTLGKRGGWCDGHRVCNCRK